jgi:predicted acylesterase/phospholipase RssA
VVLHDDGVGLSLSGGGFRATLFHLGVIRLLQKAGILQNVKQISSVSGGSVVAAHLVQNWTTYLADFDKAALELISFIRSDIRGRILRRWILSWIFIPVRLFMRGKWRLSKILERQYAYLYKNAPLRSLGQSDTAPSIALNCTSLTTGIGCYFNKEGFIWYDIGDDGKAERRAIVASSLPLAYAVAASSAFPPLFPPVEISYKILGSDVRRFRNAFQLTDGGVYDNLGIYNLAVKDAPATLIISIAEGNFDDQIDKHYTFFVGRNVRANDLLMRQVSALRLSGLVGDQPVIIDIKQEVPRGGSQSILLEEMQRCLTNIRTDLDAFTNDEVAALIAHGYTVARQKLIGDNFISNNTDEFNWDIFKNWSALRDSRGLTRPWWKKYNVFNRNDWTSWVLALVTIAGLAFPGFATYSYLATVRQAMTTRAELATAKTGLTDFTNYIATSRAPSTASSITRWQRVRTGDCAGDDIGKTPGVLPSDSFCTSPQRTAVCWDGQTFRNNSQFGGQPWCTYKRISADNCTGGSNPGILYRCASNSGEAPSSLIPAR